MSNLSPLRFVAVLMLLLVTSHAVFAQRERFGRPRNARSTISVAPMNSVSRAARTREPRWQQGGPQFRQATTRDLINSRYERLRQQYPRPLDYPQSAEMARQDLLRQRAERDVLGNSYKPSRKRAAINAVLTLFGMTQ